MSEWSIYWILKLDSIIAYTGGVAVFAGILSLFAIAFLIGSIIWIYEAKFGSDERKSMKKILWITIPTGVGFPLLLIIFSLTSYLLPTTKEYLVITSVSYATNNERIVTTADKLFDGVEEYIDKKLSELKGGETEAAK